MNFTGIYRTLYPLIAENTYFCVHGAFLNIDTCQAQTSLNKFKQTEIKPSIFSQPQWNETRNHLQKEQWKIHIYLETKQHTFEQTINRSKKITKEIR